MSSWPEVEAPLGDAPGGEGTVWRQVACSLEAARNDCAEDARFVCGTPIAPWQIETSEGSIDMGVP